MFAGCSISSLETSSCPLMRRMARKMSHVETLRFVHMPSVQSPRFTAVVVTEVLEGQHIDRLEANSG